MCDIVLYIIFICFIFQKCILYVYLEMCVAVLESTTTTGRPTTTNIQGGTEKWNLAYINVCINHGFIGLCEDKEIKLSVVLDFLFI